MINKMTMNLIIETETYEMIHEKLKTLTGILETKHVLNAEFENEGLSHVGLYFGIYSGERCNILMNSINFPLLNCSYNEFPNTLSARYENLFGETIIKKLPPFDSAVCDYIEYFQIRKVEDADTFIALLSVNGKFIPEQLDEPKWEKYKCSFGTIEFCLCKQDISHIKMLARCHGTALKSRIKDISVHRHGGVTPSTAVNQETENMIFDWLCKKNNVIFNCNYNQIDSIK